MKNYTLITGACGGLGQSFVKICLQNKENLLLVGTSEQKLLALVNELQKNYKEILNVIELKTFVCDLSNKENRIAVIDFINNNNIIVNKLINNAGLIIEGDLLKFNDDEILKAIEVNCIGTLDLTQKIIKNRDNSQKLEILTVASLAASYPIPHMAVYAATKSFLVSMMTALSVELKDENVVITTSCPSGMATTQAMKDSIKSMGLGGKLSTLPTDKVAKVSLKALKKRKALVVPGVINKFVAVISKPFSLRFLAKTTGKMWKKSQTKRGF